MDEILQTDRLILRQMTRQDLPDLRKMLKDAEVMTAYEHAFSEQEVLDWLARQQERYQKDGFGLWAVIKKDTGEMIGQCGLTMQTVEERRVPEIGYLFKKAYWHQGYATEAAQGCRQYAFEVLGLPEVFSIIRDTNLPSQRVALRNGMTRRGEFVKHYYGMDMPHFVYSVRKEELPGQPAGKDDKNGD